MHHRCARVVAAGANEGAFLSAGAVVAGLVSITANHQRGRCQGRVPPCPAGRSKDVSTSCLHPPTRIRDAVARAHPPAVVTAVRTVPAQPVPERLGPAQAAVRAPPPSTPAAPTRPAATSGGMFSTGAFAASIPAADGSAPRNSDRPGDRRPARTDSPRSGAPRGTRNDSSRGGAPVRSDRPARTDRPARGDQRPTDPSRNPRGRGGRRSAAADDRSPVVFAAHAPRSYDAPAGAAYAGCRLTLRRRQDGDR